MDIDYKIKAQLMSLLMLVIFILMLSILLTFAELSLNYNQMSQSSSIASSTSDYASIIQPSLSSLVRSSASRALLVLAEYESQPAIRKNNFITNASLYISSLVTNGTLPGVSPSSPAGQYLSNAMGNLTISAYNSMIIKSINASYRIVKIAQTYPNVTQYSPYSISITFTELIDINSSTGTFSYEIPMNVSVPLSGAPDLFYAQSGVINSINFTQDYRAEGLIQPQGHASNPSTVNYAIAGNTVGIEYGIAFKVPPTVSCSGTSSVANSIPAQFSSSPLNKTAIIVTQNALGITSGTNPCINAYGGLITNATASTSLSIPWLLYQIAPSSGNFISGIQTGQQLLIYGPKLEVLNISDVQSSFYHNFYIASQFVPSYLERAGGRLSFIPSQYGIFDLLGNIQVANLAKGQISTGTSNFPIGNSPRSIFGWVDNAGSGSTYSIFGYGPASPGAQFDLLVSSNVLSVSINGNSINSTFSVPINKWSFVGVAYSNSIATFYLNNQTPQSYPISGLSTQASNSLIGGKNYTGQISNIQLYNSSLSPYQVAQLYLGGPQGLPIDPANIVGWWPLNGNANDYSGQGNNGSVSLNASYNFPRNYTFDSVFSIPIRFSSTLNYMALPGVLSCNSNMQCTSNSLAHVYLTGLPIGIEGISYAAHFNGQSSYVSLPYSNIGNTITYSIWINPLGTANSWYLLSYMGTLLSFSANSLTFTPNVTSGNVLTASVPIQTTKWTNIIITQSGNTATAYLNGVQIRSNSIASIDTNSISSEIGGYGSTYNCQCQIENVQIYNASISPAQANYLYKEGIFGMPILPSNIVGWWPLDGNSNDYSGRGNNGTPNSVNYIPIGIPNATYFPSNNNTNFQSEGQFFGFK
ncbi:MAG: LamG-like jellyroll fold domain-containing protein [Candidatus Micrarchaeaceae archaeon]